MPPSTTAEQLSTTETQSIWSTRPKEDLSTEIPSSVYTKIEVTPTTLENGPATENTSTGTTENSKTTKGADIVTTLKGRASTTQMVQTMGTEAWWWTTEAVTQNSHVTEASSVTTAKTETSTVTNTIQITSEVTETVYARAHFIF